MGSIGNGIASLFGFGSAQRQQTNDNNSAGANLGNAGNTLGYAQGDINNQGSALGNVNNSLNQGYQSIGGESQPINNENTQAGNQAGLAALYGGAANSNFGNVLGASLSADGFNGPGGAYNPNFDPLSSTGNSLINQYADKTAPMYDNAVASANHDLAGRGLTSSNSIAPAEVGQIRQQQASDVGNFTRNLGVQDQQEVYNRLGNAMNLINGVGGAAQQGYGNAGNAYGNVAGAYGSQAGAYDNNASGYGNLSSGYGNTAGSEENLAGGYGNLATGYATGAKSYGDQSQQQSSTLGGLAALFPAKALGGWL